MAKNVTEADVALARIKADAARSKDIWISVRFIAGSFAAVCIVWMIANAIIKITDRPPWIHFLEWIFGLSAPVIFIIVRQESRLRAIGEGLTVAPIPQLSSDESEENSS